jgi:hypothetical protein
MIYVERDMYVVAARPPKYSARAGVLATEGTDFRRRQRFHAVSLYNALSHGSECQPCKISAKCAGALTTTESDGTK